MGIYGSLGRFISEVIPGSDPIFAVAVVLLVASAIGIGFVLLQKKDEQNS
jgi:hypothetical protein